jgi:hypothetical protein
MMLRVVIDQICYELKNIDKSSQNTMKYSFKFFKMIQ